VLGFIKTGLQDFSISRSTERARGWGIDVAAMTSALAEKEKTPA